MVRKPVFIAEVDNGTTEQQHQVYLPGEGKDLRQRKTVFQQHTAFGYLDI
jgi:hypothetical protein